jgi:AcrR family transcriptional regulator
MQRRSATRPRRRPNQARSERRVRRILDCAARLLERVGPNRLNTNLIARELGMSVGTLYHYFPNKHAVLHVLGADWLEQWQQAFDEIRQRSRSQPDLGTFVDGHVGRMLEVYQRQAGVLHLVQAMFTIPELRALDTRQDDIAVLKLAAVFRAFGVPGGSAERRRIARLYVKLANTLLLEAVRQTGTARRRTLDDLKLLLLRLLERGR